MIIGIGIDSVEIERFKDWHNYSDVQLTRIYSVQEIHYCRENQIKSAERFAVRFAAREALFKALNVSIPFLQLCKAVQVAKNSTGKPEMIVNWQSLSISHADYIVLLSLTHTKTTATAMVVVEKKSR